MLQFRFMLDRIPFYENYNNKAYFAGSGVGLRSGW